MADDDLDARYRERIGLGPLRPRSDPVWAPGPTRKAPGEDHGRPPNPSAASAADTHQAAHDHGALARHPGSPNRPTDALEARLARLEARAAHADRRTLPRSFAFALDGHGATGLYTHCPVEPEVVCGLMVWPVDGLWIETIQIGRCEFVESDGLNPKDDLRAFFLQHNGPKPITLYPCVGITIGIKNESPRRLTVEGALFVVPLDVARPDYR